MSNLCKISILVLWMCIKLIDAKEDIFKNKFDEIKNLGYSPIVGILTSPEPFNHKIELYSKGIIEASLVHYIESLGAIIYPISYLEPEEILKQKVNKVNLIVISGIDEFAIDEFNNNHFSKYANASFTILKEAENINNNRTYFPVFALGTGINLLHYYYIRNYSLASSSIKLGKYFSQLVITHDSLSKSIFFKNMTKDFFFKLSDDFSICSSFEGKINAKTHLENWGIMNRLQITCISLNSEYNETSVGCAEDLLFPFFGFSFHPDFPGFDLNKNRKCPYREITLQMSYYLGNFLANSGRKGKKFQAQDYDDFKLSSQFFKNLEGNFIYIIY